MLPITFSCHQHEWLHAPLLELHSCWQCTEHRQWSPCHDLLTDWVKKLEKVMQIIQKSGTIFFTVRAKKTSTCKAINDDSLQGIYKLSNRWVIVRPTVKTNSTKCVL